MVTYSPRRRSLLSLVSSFLALAVLLLAGCGGTSESSVAGTYDLDKAAVKAAMQKEIDAMPEEEKGMAAFAMGMIDMMNITLTLNADKTAAMSMSAMGDSENATGTWALDGDNITITMAAPGETAESITGTVDGDTITLKSPDEEETPFDMVFKKKT